MDCRVFDKFIHTTEYGRLYRIFEKLFLGLLFVYLFCLTYDTTAFPVNLLSGMEDVLFRLMLLAVVLKSCFRLDRWKELLPGIGVAGFCFLVSALHPEGLFSFRFLGLLVLGCIGTEVDAVIRGQVLINGYLLLMAAVCAYSGVIYNYMYLQNGEIRESWGICYPTEFASYLFFAVLLFWVGWKKVPAAVSLILMVPVFFLSKFVACSDTGVICSLLFGALVLAGYATSAYGKKYSKSRAYVLGKKIFDFLLIAAFPVFGVLMAALMGLYASGNRLGIRLNELLTGRLSISVRVLKEVGIHMWGAKLKQQGNGFSTFPVSGYDFVDSSYPLIVLQYGWIAFGVLMLLWMWMARKAVKRKDYRFAIGMGFIAFHSLAEHHFTDLNYNILLILPMASYVGRETKDAFPEREPFGNMPQNGRSVFGKAAGNRSLKGIPGVLILLGVLAASPIWLSVLRTCAGLQRLQNYEWGFLLILLVCSLFLVCLLGMGAAFWLFSAEDKKKVFRNRSCVFGMSAAVAILLGAGLFRFTCKFPEADAGILSENREILTQIVSAADGKVYDSEFPVIYRKAGIDISYGGFAGENLCRKVNTTLVVNRDRELMILLKCGFRYAAISDHSSVYTNDLGVIRYLESNGYELSDFYNEIRSAELPISMSAPVDLWAGTYEVIYRVRFSNIDCQGIQSETKQENLPRESDNSVNNKEIQDLESQDKVDSVKEAKKREIAQVMIVGHSGAEILYKEMITEDMTEENGELTYTVNLRLERDTPGVKFYIYKEGDCQLEIREITYERVE